MTREDLLPDFTKAYYRYYDVKEENIEPPFVAEAYFASHNEQYLLIKAAKIADIDACEYVYFASEDRLSLDRLNYLCETAWARGQERITPFYGHKNSDITLYILADSIDSDAAKAAGSVKKSVSYKHGLYGWSNFRLVTIECSEGFATYNRQGRALKKLVGNILKKPYKGEKK